MKQLTIILLGLIGFAQAQFAPTSARTRFVSGIAFGTKDSTFYGAADSLVVTINRQGRMMYRSTDGYWKILSNVGGSDFVPYTGAVDNVNLGTYRLTARSVALDTLRATSSAGAALYSNSGTQVALFGAGGGSGTTLYGGLNGTSFAFSLDGTVNSLTLGRGSGSVSSNVAFGSIALFANTTGAGNTAIGNAAVSSNTTSSNNTGIGRSSLISTTGSQNTALGAFAGTNLTTGSNNTYIGYFTPSSGLAVSNETVIGASTTGNGSNTVTIGNSSVTDNYFSGNVRGGSFIRSGGTSTQYLMADGSVKDSTYVNLQGNQIVAGNKTFTGPIFNVINSSTVTATKTNDGTDANNSGVGTFNVSSATASSRLAAVWLDADGGDFVNVDYATITKTGGGRLDIDNYATSQPITMSFATTERFRLASTGDLTVLGVYNATVGGTNRDVFVDNTGLIGYVSSFRASKKNIAPISNTDWLHRLNPVTFNYRVKDSTGNYTDSAYKELEYGLVAEEVETVNKEMVFYDVDSSGNKKLRGVHYSKLIIPLLAEVKEHKKRIDAQDKIIEALLTRIKALEAKLN